MRYAPVFSNVRWHHVINDMSSIKMIENDQVLPIGETTINDTMFTLPLGETSINDTMFTLPLGETTINDTMFTLPLGETTCK